MEVALSVTTITQMNRGKKKKLNIDKWKINVRKLENLLDMCKYTPSAYMYFYKNLK